MSLNMWTDGVVEEVIPKRGALSEESGLLDEAAGEGVAASLAGGAGAPALGGRAVPVQLAGSHAAAPVRSNSSNGGGAQTLAAARASSATIGRSIAPRSGERPDSRKSQRLSVSLVIPAKNEARNLAYVLEHLPGGIHEVILVDGRSSDVTTVMARHCLPDIRIISEPGAGKGNALRAGFEAATGDVIVAMDADGSMSPEEIPHYVYFLEQGYDLVKGSRFVAGGGSLDITLIRRLGNLGLLTIANLLYGSQFSDLCYGFFGFRRQFLEHLKLRSSGFEIETEIMVRAQVTGLRIAEIPSLELPRRQGSSNLRAFRDGQRVLKTLFLERVRAAEEGASHANR